MFHSLQDCPVIFADMAEAAGLLQICRHDSQRLCLASLTLAQIADGCLGAGISHQMKTTQSSHGNNFSLFQIPGNSV